MGNKSSHELANKFSNLSTNKTRTALMQKFFDALEEGNTTTVLSLIIRKKPDVNYRFEDLRGLTPLMIASFKGHLSIVRILIENGADCNAVIKDGYSCLFLAICNGQTDVIQYLIDNRIKCKIDINKREYKDEKTALHLACENGLLDIVKLLIENGADCNATDSDGNTCLYSAVWDGQTDVVRYLTSKRTEYQININKRNKKGQTSLHIACAHGHLKIAVLLIENGANVKALDNDLDSCLFLAILNGHMDVVRYFVEERDTYEIDINRRNKKGQTLLHAACSKGRLYFVKLLIENGADCNKTCHRGVSPLHLACQNGHFDTVQLLVENGADYGAVDEYGDTCLIDALSNSHDNIVKYLIDLKDSINYRNEKQQTLLHKACMIPSSLDIIELLIEKGVNCNAVDVEGCSCLFYAVLCGHTEALRYFIDKRVRYKIDIHKSNNTNQTLLHAACVKGLINNVKLLLDIGVDCNLTDTAGQTCLVYALENGHTDIGRYLIENKNVYNVDINKRDHCGLSSPLQVALKLDQVELAHLLHRNGAAVL